MKMWQIPEFSKDLGVQTSPYYSQSSGFGKTRSTFVARCHDFPNTMSTHRFSLNTARQNFRCLCQRRL